MNVVLIGYRGTGKSTVGKLLAPRLGFRYVGLDDEIVRRAGRPIPDIVAAEGWESFRDLEAEVVRDTSLQDRCVLDTGGGAVLRAENVGHLQKGGVIFLLTSTTADIVKRIQGGTQRPSLGSGKSFTEEVQEVLRERQPKYEAAAQYQVDTSRLSAEEAVRKIEESFRRQIPAGA